MKKLFLIILTLSLVASGLSSAAFAKKKKSGSEDNSVSRPKATTKGLDWDKKVGSEAYEGALSEMESKEIPVDSAKDKALVSRLNKILNNLKKQSQIPDLPYEVHLVEHPMVNAVCYPSGKIFFFKGLFDLEKGGFVDSKSDDEIAAVMGHEMAHATLRHAYRKQQKAKTISMLGTIGSIATQNVAGGKWQGLFETTFDVSTGLYFPKYSRDNESESDIEGVFMLMGAGYNPDGAVRIWKRAQKDAGKTDLNQALFSSHPSSENRAETLEKKIAKIRAAKTEQTAKN